MFWRLVVEFPSNQEIHQASLEGEYFREEIWYYRKGGLVIGVTWELFKVPIKILESIGQVTWSKVNMYAKQSRILIKTMELHDEVKKNLKTKYPYLLVDIFWISETRFILRGRIVTP